jgi:hypothetical protein
MISRASHWLACLLPAIAAPSAGLAADHYLLFNGDTMKGQPETGRAMLDAMANFPATAKVKQ